MKRRRSRRIGSRRLAHTLFELRGDPRDTPLYGVREAAAYVGVARSTLRHWLKKPARGRALIETPDGGTELSFYNLLEAHVLRIAVERNVPIRRLRVGVEELRAKAPALPHPLLANELFTGGPFRSLFIKSIAGVEDIGHGGQLALRQLVRRYLSRIEFDQTGPIRFRPFGYRHIAIEHKVSGGRPVVLGTGILAEMLARRHRAGEAVQDLARDYRITPSDVREAIRYAA